MTFGVGRAFYELSPRQRDPNFKVEPPYEDWETELHEPPPKQI